MVLQFAWFEFANSSSLGFYADGRLHTGDEAARLFPAKFPSKAGGLPVRDALWVRSQKSGKPTRLPFAAGGAPEEEITYGAEGVPARAGKLWFPTVRGVAVVDPLRLARNELAPPVIVERLVVDRAEVALADNLRLPHGSRAVEFHFTALSFVDPSKVKFRYLLEGFDRDWVEAGAASGRGWTYVFTRSGSTWTQQQKLMASDGASGDVFGYSVAISGETAVIGARADVVGSAGEVGLAYIFTRTGTTWTLQQKLTAGDGIASDSFGYSVAVSGDTAVIAAVGDDILAANDNRGSAYVFTRTGTTWSEQAKFTAHSNQAGGGFGNDVAVSGNTVVVGQPLETIGTTPNQGAAYVFMRTGSTWTEQQRLFKATGGENGDGFGVSVSIDGETLVVGAAGFSAVGSKGTAYVYVRANSTWTLQQQLLSNDLEFSDQLAKASDISGDTIILGAFADAFGNNNSNQGSAYIFKRVGSTWTQTQT